jgi:pyruvate,water dikinase
VNKRSGRVKEQQSGKREIVIRAKVGGGTEQVSSRQEVTNLVTLPTRALKRLWKLGMEIERHYGAPQDIEWAWVHDGSKAGTLFILQSRPITALPEPLHISGPMRLIVPMLAEMWPTRPYPLDMTTFTGAVEHAIGNFLASMIGRSAPKPDEMFQEEDGVIVQFKAPQFHPSPGILIEPWMAMWRTRHNNPAHWESDPRIPEILTEIRAMEQRDLPSLTWRQNIETLNGALALIPRAMELRERYFPQALLGLARLWLLLTLAGRREFFGVLVSGVKTKTTETNQALEDLAGQIRADSLLRDVFQHTEIQDLRNKLESSDTGQTFLGRFQLFLERYGHRETALTISRPAWKDQPDAVLGILRVLAGTESVRPGHYEAWQKTRDELLTHSILGTPLLRKLFLKSLASARAFFQIREDTHFYLTLAQPTIRRISLELGRRLTEVRALTELEEVFHLRLVELEDIGKKWPPSESAIADIREMVARRKALRERLADKPMFDPRLLAVTSPAHEEKDVLLRGTSGSPGMARGPARVVRDISEFGKLQAGDVLVAPVTNPSWTPLFQRAAAVVVDMGGSASHAAIVAREYGVPAVMGTMNGTRLLQDGQWIQVDGSRGLILKAEEPT